MASEEPLQLGGLSGTLTKPDRPASPHLVVIVAGSGTTNRDGNHGGGGTAPGQQPDMYRQLSEALAAQGIASFRYDKRGVGASRALVPDRASATKLVIQDFAADVATVVNGLRQRADAASIVVAGHSEGALLALIAAPHMAVSGLALLSAPGLPFVDVLERQLAKRPLPADLSAAVAGMIAAYRSDAPISNWPSELASLFNPLNDAFMRSVARLDPRDLLRPITIPVLVVGGAKDIQIERADFDRLTDQRSARHEILWVDDMAHSLKAVKAADTSPLDAYMRERPLSQAFVAGFVNWLKALPPKATQ